MELLCWVLFIILLFLYYNPSCQCYPRFNFLAAIWAEGEPVTFQVGDYAFCGTAAFAGMPGGLDGLIYELPNILWSVVVVNTEAAELLFDLADLDG